MQQYLVWTILLSFESNLFCYVMMVAGAAKILLAFAVIGTAMNIVFNLTLVPAFGLAGGCLVLILTKLVMTVLTFSYCQIKFRFVGPLDFVFPVVLGAGTYALFLAMKPLTGTHPAVTLCVVLYLAVLWTVGPRFIGRFPSRVTSATTS
jgi:O-antigen/teichoic acid export membrane protein